MSGGGLGEALPAATFGFREPGLRTIFDLSFFVLITTIGLNVVFGIIVDSFSELRDEKYQTQEIMESECFICGLKAFDFERLGNGYDTHVHCEHNMWDYVCFFLHLEVCACASVSVRACGLAWFSKEETKVILNWASLAQTLFVAAIVPFLLLFLLLLFAVACRPTHQQEKDHTEYTAHEQFVFEQFQRNEYAFFPVNHALSLEGVRDNGVEDRLEKVEGALQQVLSRMQQDADSRAAEEKRREIEVCAPHCCVCFMAILRAGGGGGFGRAEQGARSSAGGGGFQCVACVSLCCVLCCVWRLCCHQLINTRLLTTCCATPQESKASLKRKSTLQRQQTSQASQDDSDDDHGSGEQ